LTTFKSLFSILHEKEDIIVEAYKMTRLRRTPSQKLAHNTTTISRMHHLSQHLLAIFPAHFFLITSGGYDYYILP
jgi:hypothetical protein